MMERLRYTIAGHGVEIETFSKKRTNELLPSFAPFYTELDEEECNVLFRLEGNHTIHCDGMISVEQFSRLPNRYTVFENEEETIIRMSRGEVSYHLRFLSDFSRVETDLTMTLESEATYLNSFVMIAFTLASTPLKTVKLHASVIEKEGKAILFLGKSGTGKSTHARLWQDYVAECSLLNDDEPVLRIMDDGEVWVFGTPWSGKTPCYRNVSAKVSAIVRLYQHPKNILTQLRGMDAFTAVFQSAGILRSDRRHRDLLFDNIAQLTGVIPVYRLDCLPDKGAVMLSETVL
ncbi:MAG: hypothetical protein ACK5JU_05290 [Bacteroidales bacterium]